MSKRKADDQKIIETVIAIDVTLIALFDQLRELHPAIAMKSVELLREASQKRAAGMPGVQANIESYCRVLTTPPTQPAAH